MKNMKATKINILGLLAIAVMVVLQSCGGTKTVVNATPKKTKNFAFDFVESNKLQSVLDLAAAENKLVFLDVYTTWCLPCKMMEENVFTDKTTAAIINKDFISYKVDAEKSNGLNVAFQYDVSEYPTILFLDAQGNVLERGVGTHYHTKLVNLAASALVKARISE
ncbi:MAG: thiol:disulfide interchange protein [Saprospiraceae bacterium]|jgi:thiol:disulfide interchange protein